MCGVKVKCIHIDVFVTIACHLQGFGKLAIAKPVSITACFQFEIYIGCNYMPNLKA